MNQHSDDQNRTKSQLQRGFSEVEFILLVSSGILIAGILAHFVFDQNLQVQKLNAIISRDVVRLAVESRLLDPEVITKSASVLPNDQNGANLRACILGEKNCPSVNGNCCLSRARKAMPIIDLGDDRKLIGGTVKDPACLDAKGQPHNGQTCFATSRVAVDPVCANGKDSCQKATAIIIHYQIMFNLPLIKDNPELSSLERSVSILLNSD